LKINLKKVEVLIMYMTIRDLLELYVDAGLLKVEIYDLETSETIYRGQGDMIPDEYLDLDIQSLDAPYRDVQVINVDSAEG
jgi:hypothetical protein